MPVAGLLTVKEAATLLGVVESSVRHAIRDERLKGQKAGRDWLLDPKDVEAYRVARRASGKPYKKDTGDE